MFESATPSVEISIPFARASVWDVPRVIDSDIFVSARDVSGTQLLPLRTCAEESPLTPTIPPFAKESDAAGSRAQWLAKRARVDVFVATDGLDTNP